MSIVATAPTPKSSASRFRVLGTWILTISICTLLFICEPIWSDQTISDIVLETAGLLLVGVATFGRLWTSMYISGRKTRELITEGPYSVVRNPLYVFNLAGCLGLGLSTESLFICVILLLAFAAYYPSVILNEEKILSEVHGEGYGAYCLRVPRFVPSFASYHEPETCTVNMRTYKKSFLHATVFLWIYAALQVVERMHELKLLPTVFKIL